MGSQAQESAVLDVGCGYCQFLRALQSRGLRLLRGIDVEANAVAYGRQLGLQVDECTVGDFLGAPGTDRYDLIMMSHVLEHLPKDQVIETLRGLRALLRPGGTLIVCVPNAQSNTGAYWAYEDFTHTTLFTAGSLVYVARMAGFADIRFIDVDATAGSSLPRRTLRRLLLAAYRANRHFWNKVTASAYHAPSPEIYSYEIKVALRG